MSAHQRRSNTAPAAGGGSGGGVSRLSSMSSPGRQHSRTASMAAADDASFAAAQDLASVMNAPTASSSWLPAWPFAQAGDADAPPPPLPPGTLPEVALSDFSRYMRTIGDRLESFGRDRDASQQRSQGALNPDDLRASQGQGLVAAMRDVPAPFFQESFDLDQPQLWEQLVQVHSEEARQESLEVLSGHLDVVETHLVREIAARTDNFFDASGYIQDVRGSVARLYQQVSGLRKQMHGLEQETGTTVQTSQRLQRQRANLMSTLDVLHAMEGVAQAQSALQGLLPRAGGVSLDYAGAIDVLEVLQGVLDDEALLGLECFKHLPEQIIETAQAVDDLMTSDFLDRTRFTAEPAVAGGILDRLRLQVATSAATTPRRRASSSLSPSRQLSAEEGAELATLAALRLADGAAVERVVGWLERAAAAGGGSQQAAAPVSPGGWPAAAGDECGDGDGDGATLQEVLLPLVMGLRRMGRLPATLRDFREMRIAGLKEALSRLIEGCLEVLDPDTASPGDTSHLVAAHRSSSPSKEPPTTAARLQRLPGEHFQWVLEAVVLAVQAYVNHCTAVGEAVQTILAAAKASKQQLAVAALDDKECCQAVAEAAAARWSKLLSSRARSSGEAGSGGGGGGSSIRLSELQRVLELTDVLASVVEEYGVRGVLGLRSALQQLCKAALDGMHAKTLSKLTTLLDQEQWAAVEVAPQFQDMVEGLEQRGGLPAPDPAAQSGGSQAAAAAEGSGTGSTSSSVNGSRRPSGDVQAAATAAPQANGGSPANLPLPPSEESGVAAEVPRKFTITPPEGVDIPPSQQANGGGGSGPARVLWVAGQPYHVVNTQLLLLSMLRDYLAFRDAVPAFSAEVAQRVLELLKVFNSRTCQLVLGAGAMQVSGLKSITAKHLAISCQCLGAFMALQPPLVQLFIAGVQAPRRDMLVADFGRALQDYRIHHDEVCSKLVSIMRERLSINIKQLPALAAAWPAGGERAEAPAPSSFATTAAKQLNILSGALSPLLLPAEVHSIFGRIGLMFSRTLAEAYELLEPHGDAWEQQLRADMQFLLNCLRNLPMDPAERDSNLERLTQLFERRFLLGPAPPAPSWQPARPAAAPAANSPAAPPTIVSAAGEYTVEAAHAAAEPEPSTAAALAAARGSFADAEASPAAAADAPVLPQLAAADADAGGGASTVSAAAPPEDELLSLVAEAPAPPPQQGQEQQQSSDQHDLGSLHLLQQAYSEQEEGEEVQVATQQQGQPPEEPGQQDTQRQRQQQQPEHPLA